MGHIAAPEPARDCRAPTGRASCCSTGVPRRATQQKALLWTYKAGCKVERPRSALGLLNRRPSRQEVGPQEDL